MTHAAAGFKNLLYEEHNARVHLLATALVIVVAAKFPIATWEWLILILVRSMARITEALNAAIEKLADRVCPEHDPLIGQCKDVAATVVLLASICALLCGAIIFVPRLAGLIAP